MFFVFFLFFFVVFLLIVVVFCQFCFFLFFEENHKEFKRKPVFFVFLKDIEGVLEEKCFCLLFFEENHKEFKRKPGNRGVLFRFLVFFF